MISTNQFRSGLYIKVNEKLFVIIESQHYKPGKGGAIVRTKLRDLKSGTVVDRTFRAGETVDAVFVEDKKYQYLYHADGQYHFMDNETYDQISLAEDKVGDVKRFLKENTGVTVSIVITSPTFIKSGT
jgi:elongation factor P